MPDLIVRTEGILDAASRLEELEGASSGGFDLLSEKMRNLYASWHGTGAEAVLADFQDLSRKMPESEKEMAGFLRLVSRKPNKKASAFHDSVNSR